MQSIESYSEVLSKYISSVTEENRGKVRVAIVLVRIRMLQVTLRLRTGVLPTEDQRTPMINKYTICDKMHAKYGHVNIVKQDSYEYIK